MDDVSKGGQGRTECGVKMGEQGEACEVRGGSAACGDFIGRNKIKFGYRP